VHWLADDAGHYQNNLCRSWADALDNFTYIPHEQTSDAETTLAGIVRDYPDLHRFDIYAAGTGEQLQIARDLFLKRGLQQQCWHEYAC